ncbi:Lectin C-type domain [Halocaridina rubra]|uniref:Lectin C-type domain n=1 Tax=Halocaridina rubra TaxID=373956 RepID=A0AAN8WTR0_HALRR
MKYLLLLGLVVVGVASPQNRRSKSSSRSRSSGDVDGTNNGSEYHYSWVHDGGKERTHDSAVSYCNRLGGGWVPISIETSGENSFVTRVISQHKLDYIWTGGVKSGSNWRWLNGGSFRGLGWSPNGGFKRPQPDNREGDENCLAVLNNFYKDGIKWHDVACHHPKPIICERTA